MKGYGLPRNHDVGSPDLQDIRVYGLKTSAGSITGRALQRSCSKRRSRRIWKKKARRDGKPTIED